MVYPSHGTLPTEQTRTGKSTTEEPSWPTPLGEPGASGGSSGPRLSPQSRFSKAVADGSPLRGLFSLLASIAALAGTILAVTQFYTLNANNRLARANEAVSRLLLSKEIRELTDVIGSKTSRGTDYTSAFSDPELWLAINGYMNALELIAGSVNGGSQDERFVCKNLAVIYYKYGKAFLHGKSGALPTGSAWKVTSDGSVRPLFDNAVYFPEMRRLYERWFPSGSYPSAGPCA
jgi:hypothetical protein